MTTTTRINVSTALLTDQYELTMLRSALADGTAHHRAVFEVFARRLPNGRRYGVVAGLGRFLAALNDFRFEPEHLDHLADAGVIDDATRTYLENFTFTGTIHGYREGEIYFANSPVLTIEGTFGEAVLLETLILSIYNHDTAVASAAARMRTAAGNRTLLEMGSRRTHEQAAVAAARAAYLAGFDATSNLAAGHTYNIPTAGTAAHAFTLAHTSEVAAYRSQLNTLGTGTTLLVDTYDIETGIRDAVREAGPTLGGIRIDSGNLVDEARRARTLLDTLGAIHTRIAVTSDLNEHLIAELAHTPVDTYGVGTQLVTGSGAPTASMVYKLVAISDSPTGPLRPVAKRAEGKASVGGRKFAHRVINAYGVAEAEQLTTNPDQAPPAGGRALQVLVATDGQIVHDPILEQIRAHHRTAKAELHERDLDLTPAAPRLTATYTDEQVQQP